MIQNFKLLFPVILMLVTCSGCLKKTQIKQVSSKPCIKHEKSKKQPRRAWWRKKKPTVCKPVVVAPQKSQETIISERDKKISVLCKEFIDLDNTKINWNIFCEKISSYVKDDPEFTEVCQLLDEVKTSTSATSTCLKLKPYLKKLPKVVYDEFEKFSVYGLLSLIRSRMNQEVANEAPEVKPASPAPSDKPSNNKVNA